MLKKAQKPTLTQKDIDREDFDIFKHLDFNPLRQLEENQKIEVDLNDEGWPISKDKHYIPSLESVARLNMLQSLKNKNKTSSFNEKPNLYKKQQETESKDPFKNDLSIDTY